MPRGIPNAKRDDLGMRYTTFQVPLLPNPKNAGSNYLRYESQTIWARNAARANKSKTAEELGASVSEGRRGSKVIVIHPGSRWLRIGRASEVAPVVIPHVIARKHKPPVPPPTFVPCISRPQKGKEKLLPSTKKGDEYSVENLSDDPVNEKIAAIAISLRERMRFYKLKVVGNASRIAANFNDRLEGEPVADNDSLRIDWKYAPPNDEVLVGEKALRLSDPQKLGYTIKWPFHGSHFNTRDYQSHQNLMNDIEAVWGETLKTRMKVDPKSFKEYSVILVIPDLWDRFYVHELVDMLLVNMGFKQVVCQQESLAATYGAGISNACVIDIGAVKTSVTCVDDGLVVAETRMSLSVGGDDITEFLYVLLDRISFPYREIDLARSYDWVVMEDIKSRICTLSESDVALNLYDFVVRRPGEPAKKYGLRAYDEVILAPMSIFEPRIVDFENKRLSLRLASHPDVTDEIQEYIADRLTHAMLISTQHLMPQAHPQAPSSPPPLAQTAVPPSVPASGVVTPQPESTPGIANSEESQDKADIESSKDKLDDSTLTDGGSKKSESQAETMDIDVEMMEEKPNIKEFPTHVTEATQSKPPFQEATAQPQQPQQTQSSQQNPPIVAPMNTAFLGNLPIDVPFEASKLPLDVAVFNSARAAGGDEKIRKYLQAVLVVGGTALIPGMSHALESRLQAIATPLVPNMEKVQIIPPPKDVDPRMLVWKGAAVLGKMDGVADLWLTSADWQLFGMRGLRERCYFL